MGREDRIVQEMIRTGGEVPRYDGRAMEVPKTEGGS